MRQTGRERQEEKDRKRKTGRERQRARRIEGQIKKKKYAEIKGGKSIYKKK